MHLFLSHYYLIENFLNSNILNLTNSNCSNDCFKDNVTIDYENNKCIGTCSKYEYNNKCYKECPKGTYPLFCDNNNNCEIYSKKCFDNCTRNNPFLLINKCVFNCSIIQRQNKLCITRYINDTDKDYYSFDIIIEQIRYELTHNFNNSVIDGDIINEKILI